MNTNLNITNFRKFPSERHDQFKTYPEQLLCIDEYNERTKAKSPKGHKEIFQTIKSEPPKRNSHSPKIKSTIRIPPSKSNRNGHREYQNNPNHRQMNNVRAPNYQKHQSKSQLFHPRTFYASKHRSYETPHRNTNSAPIPIYQNHNTRNHSPEHRATNQFPRIRPPYDTKYHGQEMKEIPMHRTLCQYPPERTTWLAPNRFDTHPTNAIWTSSTKDNSNEPKPTNERKEFARQIADYLIIQREIQAQLSLYAENTSSRPTQLHRDTKGHVTGSEKRDQDSQQNIALGVNTLPVQREVFQPVKQRKELFPSEFVSFDDEQWHLYDTQQQDNEIFTRKVEIKNLLEGIIHQIFPEAKLYIFGSTITGCGSKDSDLDLCIYLLSPNNDYPTDKDFTVPILNRICSLLRRSQTTWGSFRNPPYVRRGARIPILKIEAAINVSGRRKKLDVDLNCNHINGIYNSTLLRDYAKIDERFPALSLLIKDWAKGVGINDASKGTFNSLSIELMIVHYLQCVANPPVLPNLQFLFPTRYQFKSRIDKGQLEDNFPQPPRYKINQQSLGELLIGFFNYFYKFEFESKAITICHGDVIPTHHLTSSFTNEVHIQDPTNYENTAKNVTQLKLIRRLLSAKRYNLLSNHSGEGSHETWKLINERKSQDGLFDW